MKSLRRFIAINLALILLVALLPLQTLATELTLKDGVHYTLEEGEEYPTDSFFIESSGLYSIRTTAPGSCSVQSSYSTYANLYRFVRVNDGESAQCYEGHDFYEGYDENYDSSTASITYFFDGGLSYKTGILDSYYPSEYVKKGHEGGYDITLTKEQCQELKLNEDTEFEYIGNRLFYIFRPTTDGVYFFSSSTDCNLEIFYYYVNGANSNVYERTAKWGKTGENGGVSCYLEANQPYYIALDSVDGNEELNGTIRASKNDAFSFLNACKGDYAGFNKEDGYYISGDYYNFLKLYCRTPVELALVFLNKIQGWGGSCFGMSSVYALYQAGQLDPSTYQKSAKNLSDLNWPRNDKAILSLINFYHLIQYTDRWSHYHFDLGLHLGADYLDNSEQVVNEIKLSANPVVIGLELWPYGGHAVVATGITEEDSGYEIDIWDPNHFETDTLYVSKDYAEKSMASGNYNISKLITAYTVDDLPNLDYWLNISDDAEPYEASVQIQSVDETEYLQLLTNYDSFIIEQVDPTTGVVHFAEIEQGEKVSGDIEISNGIYLNEMNTDVQMLFFLNSLSENDNPYVITYKGPDDIEYITTVTYNIELPSGYLSSTSTIGDGSISIDACGAVSTAFMQDTQHTITTVRNSTTNNWSTAQISLKSKGTRIVPSEKNVAIFADDAETDVLVSTDYCRADLGTINVSNSGIKIASNGDIEQAVENGTNRVLSSTRMTNTILFYSLGGTLIDPIMDIADGSIVSAPETPVLDGCRFDGWYTSKNYDISAEWDFSTPVTETIELYAKWTEDDDYHDWNDGEITVYPTETTDGVRTYTCTVCGETKTETIPALEHTHNYAAVVTQPTCTEKGYTTYTCRCGDSYVDDYVDALGHDFGAWTVTKEATCTEEGERTRACSRCDAVETETTAALGHDFGEWTVTKEATCTEEGERTRTCSRCDVAETEAIPALGHKWDDGVVTTEPTATKDGVKTFTCTVCGETKTEAIPATGVCDGGESCPSRSFSDVQGHWGHLSIDYCVKNGLMNGMGNGKFDPEGTLTRAMLATILWRQAGEPKATKDCTFTDLGSSSDPAASWYLDAVAWAAEVGVVNGYPDGTFAPSGAITRQEMATMLYRYAGIMKFDTSAKGDLSVFPDENQVLDYAVDAMIWANGAELITGDVVNDVACLNPLGNATRAQVATILMRFCENVAK